MSELVCEKICLGSPLKKIMYVQYANPAAFPPIVHSTRIFESAGWSVWHYGCHSDGAESLAINESRNVKVNVQLRSKSGVRQKISYAVFCLRSVIKAVSWSPDVVYVSDNMASPVGWVLRALFKKVVIYHEHDDPDQERESYFVKIVKWFRSSLAKCASIVVIPQKQRMEIFRTSLKSEVPMYCVWNCPSRAETSVPVGNKRSTSDVLGIYFHGSINLNRVSLAMIEGIGRSEIPVKIKIVGYETIGSKGTLVKLQDAARPFSKTLTLELVGPVATRGDLASQMIGMQVGWCAFNKNAKKNNVMRHLAGASNKPFDYLASGLALICPDDPEWIDLYRHYGKFCDSDDSKAIEEVVRWFYEHPEETHQMGCLGQQKVLQDWNYETQFNPVLRHVKELVASE